MSFPHKKNTFSVFMSEIVGKKRKKIHIVKYLCDIYYVY